MNILYRNKHSSSCNIKFNMRRNIDYKCGKDIVYQMLRIESDNRQEFYKRVPALRLWITVKRTILLLIFE